MTGEERKAYVRNLVDAAPPLAAEQRDRLAALLSRPANGAGKFRRRLRSVVS